MKAKIIFIDVGNYFNNTTCQEAIKQWFGEVFVLFKVKTQSITHTRTKS